LREEENVPDKMQLFREVDQYIEKLFVPHDRALTAALRESGSSGLPPIQVSPTEGRILYLLAKIAGARRILEIGTLGGYSTLCLARALPDGGRLISLELETRHAAVARKNVERAGLAEKVEIRVGPALKTLSQMLDAKEPAFDFVFIDADKTGYPDYLEQCLKLVHSGALIVADNVIRDGTVLEPNPTNADLRAIQKFNRKLADNPRLEGIAIPLIRESLDGIAVARVK
jgi:predicted O-methyltransferase YrrM